MGKCLVCGEKAQTISGKLGICQRCIMKKPENLKSIKSSICIMEQTVPKSAYVFVYFEAKTVEGISLKL